MFSVIQDAQSAELSQRHIARRAKRLKVDAAQLKLPRVVALDACQVDADRIEERVCCCASWCSKCAGAVGVPAPVLTCVSICSVAPTDMQAQLVLPAKCAFRPSSKVLPGVLSTV